MKSVLISKKEFDSNPVYNKHFLKTKMKSQHDEVTEIYDKEVPKADSTHTCLEVFCLESISLDSAFKRDENNYPQVFLKGCEYIEKNTVRYIHKNLSDFSSSDESHKE